MSDPTATRQPTEPTVEHDPSDPSWLERLLRPAPMAAIGVALSMVAWSIGNFLKPDAIDFSANLSWGSVVYLSWIAAAIAASYAGYRIVTSQPPRNEPTPLPIARALHVGLLVTAAIGSAYVAWLWYRDGIDVIGVIADNQANLLRQVIPFSAGPATLRYAAIPAAAIAMRNIFVFHLRAHPARLRSVDALSLIALGFVAVPSSRLSVLMALVTAAALVCYVDNRAPSLRRVLVVVTLAAVVLAGLNYSRNGGYYRVRGVSDPASMLLYQSVSYLGATFEGGSVTGQVLLGRTDASPQWGIGRLADPFVPSFVPGFQPENSNGISIHEISSIDGSLTTNSMFALVTLGPGIAATLSSLVLLFGAAIGTGMLLRRRNIATVLAAGPLLYGFAEVYRLNLFNDGLTIFCIASPLLIHLGLTTWARRRPTSRLHASDTRKSATRNATPTPDEPTPIPDH